MAGRPLFESLLVYENYPSDPGAAGPGALRVTGVASFELTNYPLTIAVVPGPPVLLRCLYDRGRFEDAVMERLLGHLGVLLGELSSRPGSRVGELGLLTPGEGGGRRAGNRTRGGYRPGGWG